MAEWDSLYFLSIIYKIYRGGLPYGFTGKKKVLTQNKEWQATIYISATVVHHFTNKCSLAFLRVYITFTLSWCVAMYKAPRHYRPSKWHYISAQFVVVLPIVGFHHHYTLPKIHIIIGLVKAGMFATLQATGIYASLWECDGFQTGQKVYVTLVDKVAHLYGE